MLTCVGVVVIEDRVFASIVAGKFFPCLEEGDADGCR